MVVMAVMVVMVVMSGMVWSGMGPVLIVTLLWDEHGQGTDSPGPDFIQGPFPNQTEFGLEQTKKYLVWINS